MQKSKFDKMTNCPLECVGILKGNEITTALYLNAH